MEPRACGDWRSREFSMLANEPANIGPEHWPPDARVVARVVDAGLTTGARNPLPRKDAT
jgi:hypothetical protein